MHFMYEFRATMKLLVYLKFLLYSILLKKLYKIKFIAVFTKNLEIPFEKIASVSLAFEQC